MNINNEKYKEYLDLKANWPLDDWSINSECLDKIVEILEFGKTILELGSGSSTKILSKFYNMISVEDDSTYLNLHNSHYIHINTMEGNGYDFNSLHNSIKDMNYDLLIIDGPNNGRDNVINYIDIFKKDIPIIWDDAQVYEKYAIQMSEKLGKEYKTYQCRPQGEFWKNYSNGKRFTFIDK
jgi:hypothetical protein